MAKESMKAREVKRAKLVARYAEKRKQMIAEGDYDALRTSWPSGRTLTPPPFATSGFGCGA